MSKLLTMGNAKLGDNIAVWSLPSVKTCPGATDLCKRLCYAKRFEAFRAIDYGPKLRISKSEAFIGRMVEEAKWKRLVRIHAAGDFYDADYVGDWIEIAKRTPETRYYGYTRSWRSPGLLKKLLKLKAMPNVTLLFSCDKESGIPKWAKPEDLVYMSTADDDVPASPVRIVFRVKRSTKMLKMGGSQVCPVEFGDGFGKGVTCEKCQLCFK
jgi:hypothetical protein